MQMPAGIRCPRLQGVQELLRILVVQYLLEAACCSLCGKCNDSCSNHRVTAGLQKSTTTTSTSHAETGQLLEY